MQTVLSLVIIAGGIALLYLGYSAYNSYGSEGALWMLIGGGIETIYGIARLLKGGKKRG